MDKRYIRKLDYEAPEIIEAYNNFLTLSEIAEMYGVTPPTINDLLKRYKVKRRRRGPLTYTQTQIARKTRKKLEKED